MAASENPDREWETQAEVDVCLGETGVTRDQVNRWRREGLLPDVEQAWPEAAKRAIPLARVRKSRPRKRCFG